MRALAGVVAVAVLTALIPVAGAQEEDPPQVSDPEGDGGPGGRDLVGVRLSAFDAGNASIEFLLAEEYSVPTARLLAEHTRFALFFTPTAGLPEGSAECYAHAEIGLDDASGEPATAGSIACTEEAGTFAPLEEEVSAPVFWKGRSLEVIFPLAVLAQFEAGRDALSDPYAIVAEVSKGPTTTSDEVANAIVHTWDRAPDSGTGQAWRPPGEPEEVRSVRVATEPASIDVPRFGSANATLRVENLLPRVVEIDLDSYPPDGFGARTERTNGSIPANGSLELNVTISADAEVNASAPVDIVVWADDGSRANVSVTAVVVESAASSESDPGRDRGARDGGRSPGMGLMASLAVVAAAAAVIWRRRWA